MMEVCIADASYNQSLDYSYYVGYEKSVCLYNDLMESLIILSKDVHYITKDYLKYFFFIFSFMRMNGGIKWGNNGEKNG